MAALITFRRTNLVGQERWKLLIPLGVCLCQRGNGSELALGQRFAVISRHEQSKSVVADPYSPDWTRYPDLRKVVFPNQAE
jgi:hypothetical protein